MEKENNLTVSNTIDGGITNLTPIEIMLQVDEKGETTARKLYEYLELDKRNYAKWAKRNIIENSFAEENTDYKPFVLHDERNPNPTTDYKITAKFAKHLAMSSKSERGQQAREYFITVENKLKEKLNKQSLIIPVDYEEALESLLKEVKENKRLQQQNIVLQKTVEESKPKVELYERLMNGRNAIEMNEVAKTLSITNLGRNNLFKVLRGIGILMGNNVPYQKYLGDRGLFKIIFVAVQKGEHIENIPKTLVTAKGLEYLHKKLKEHGYITENDHYIEENKQLN